MIFFMYMTYVFKNNRFLLLSFSAVIVTLPSREIAIIAFHDIPAIKHSGAYKVDISLYLDRKNKPTEKTSALITGDVNIDKNMVGINGEAKFTYPSQPKVHCYRKEIQKPEVFNDDANMAHLLRILMIKS